MLYEKLTEKIIRTCFEVSNELGCGFLEGVYEKALLIALRQAGMEVQSQVPITVYFRGEVVGTYYADLLVEESVIIELKALAKIGKEHVAQLLNYLKATDMKVGLLVNFGSPKIEYRRLNNYFNAIR